MTYLIADDETKEAVIIDPVSTHIEHYIALVKQGELTMKFALETHVHADHITASCQLRHVFHLQTAVSVRCGAISADKQLKDEDEDEIHFGKETVHVIATLGHTIGSLSFLWKDRLFTGDTLLINGCGRTDFQGGDAGVLYDSITKKIFTLPEETLIYPGHDYQGRRVSSVMQEKSINPRLSNTTREAFIALMMNLDLPKPRLINIAVPANRKCGVDETDVLQG